MTPRTINNYHYLLLSINHTIYNFHLILNLNLNPISNLFSSSYLSYLYYLIIIHSYSFMYLINYCILIAYLLIDFEYQY